MSGRLLLMGSGEIAPSMVATHRRALRDATADRVTVVDSPFGFQENADELTARIAAYFRTSLGVAVDVACLRTDTATAKKRAEAASAIRSARYVFAGPGSPSYALRVWLSAGVGPLLRDRLADGATVTLASAAALTAGTHTIPVYEIYKVGQDPFWLDGLDLTSAFGLPMVVVPHWNNAEGGTHDTSHCYIGTRRFEVLRRESTPGVVGIDEHTALLLDFSAGAATVSGAGTVTLSGGSERVLESGDTIDLETLSDILGGETQASPAPEPSLVAASFDDALSAGDADGAGKALLDALGDLGQGIAGPIVEAMVVELAAAARVGLEDPHERIRGFVDLLLEIRSRERDDGRYADADAIREGLAGLGVEVRDRPEGIEWRLVSDRSET